MTVEDQDQNQNDQDDVIEAAEDNPLSEDDPMLVEGAEAEAEIAAAEKTAHESEAEGEPNSPDGEDGQPEEKPEGGEEGQKPEGSDGEPKPEGEGKPEEPGGKSDQEQIMIPKARFDQVNSELQTVKGQLNYMQGIIDTQGNMVKTAPKAEEGQQGKEPEKSVNELITEAETKKLDLAQKYEDGYMTLVELRNQEIALDRQIRELDDQRIAEQIEGVKSSTSEAVSNASYQSKFDRSVEAKGAELREIHPYILKIADLPEKVSSGIWDFITEEASQNLAKQGINVNDGRIESHLALMEETARLTDKYGPQYTGVKIENSQQETNQQGAEQGGKKPSETAVQRAAKLDLSEQQPPAANNVGASERKELTEQDIENMSEDELADMLETAPNIVLKAAGIPNR